MKNKWSGITFVAFFWAACITSVGQALLQIQTAGNLHSSIKESSGIDQDPWGRIWTHNDGGDQARVYQINEQGATLRTLNILNAQNIDWEDITISTDGYMFVADLGNNSNDRNDLKIYKVNLNELTENQHSIAAEIIHVRYNEQVAFPPPQSQRHFDVEAIAWRNRKLYLFTKNRSSPNDGLTRIYELPDAPGSYNLSAIMTFFTSTNVSEGRITAADFSDDGSQLVLISTNKLWHFKNLSTQFSLNVPVTIFSMEPITQKEAVCFIDECKILLTDEVNDSQSSGGKIYSADFCPSGMDAKKESYQINSWFNQQINSIEVSFSTDLHGKEMIVVLYSLTGQLIFYESIRVEGKIAFILPSFITTGIYHFMVYNKDFIHHVNRMAVRND
ncbi:MAG: hypothetical protein ACK4GL_06985 [Flavobacteriales bacterium]